MEPKDLFSSFGQNPLLLGGLMGLERSIRGDDAGAGMQAGFQAANGQQRMQMLRQQQQQEAAQAQQAQAEKAERQKQFAQMTGQPIPGVSPEQMKVLQFLGPEKGGALLSRLIQDGNDPMRAAELDYKRAQIKKLNAEAAGGGVRRDTPEARAQIAQQYGLAPGSEAYKRYVLTGQLSDKGVAGGDDQDLTRNIAGGIDKLARIPSQFDSSTFENAVGPYQGAEDGGIVGGIARTFGSVMEGLTNIWGNGYTSEVRNVIAGDTEALAAAIKPLIRKPGEGPWTDDDQKRLVAVIGNLAQARNAGEYRRALEGVRQRIMANFNIQLPEITTPPPEQDGPKGPYGGLSDDDLLRGLGIAP